jgi:RHS repeat-associated protein
MGCFRDGDLSNDVTISYYLAGSATLGVDYTKPLHYGTFYIPAGQTESLAAPYKAIDDNYVEDPSGVGDGETIELHITDVVSATPYSVPTEYPYLTNGFVTDNDSPQAPKPILEGCGCSQGSDRGKIGGNSPGVGNSNSVAGWSDNPVRYSDGTALVTAADITSDADGLPWGISRSWTNAPGYATGMFFGYGMVIDEQPTLINVSVSVSVGSTNSTLAVISNGHSASYFVYNTGEYRPGELVDGTFVPNFLQETLVHDTTYDTWLFTDTTGSQSYFYGFSSGLPNHLQGQLQAYKDTDGNSISYVYDVFGRLSYTQRVSGGIAEWLTFEYWESDDNGPLLDNAGLVSDVWLVRQVGDSEPQLIEQARYDYYGHDELHGNLHDLKEVTTRDGDGNTLNTSYYRYYTSDDMVVDGQTVGYQHGLKYVVSGSAFDRLTTYATELSTPLTSFTVSDEQLAPFAGHFFKYTADQTVSEEAVPGASDPVSIGYSYEPFSDDPDWTTSDYNHWTARTIESRPDGTRNIVYTNFMGEVMLKVFDDPGSGGFCSSTERKWMTFYRYDNRGRLLFEAEPSAVLNYDANLYTDLLGYDDGNFTLLDDSHGLITDYSYYASTNSENGSVYGYLAQVAIREGELGTPIVQSRDTYVAHTARDITIVLSASHTVYSKDETTATGDQTTQYEYVYYEGGQKSREKRTEPAHEVTYQYYDTYGRPTWHVDEAGYLNFTAYDSATGAVIQQITDVDTDLMSDVPDDLETPTDGGSHLTTTYDVDSRGRTVKMTDANNNVTYTVYNDADNEVRVYPGWNDTTHKPTDPTAVTREDRAHGYTEQLTTSDMPNLDSSNRPDGSESITASHIQRLSRTYVDSFGRQAQTDNYFSLTGITYSDTPYLGTENTSGVDHPNYDATRYLYDDLGRTIKVAGPAMEVARITRTVYDTLGRTVSEWIGSSDTNSNGHPWSTSEPGQLVKKAEYEYDEGEVGDGYMTSSIDGDANETKMEYDFRGRLTQTTLPDPDGSSGSLDSPVLSTTYNNLGQVVTQTDAKGNVTTISYGVEDHLTTTTYPDPDDDGPLDAPIAYEQLNSRGLIETSVDQNGNSASYTYDGAGRATSVTGADPDGSDHPLLAPVINYAYDGVGNVRFMTDALSNTTEYQYDKANRLVTTLLPDPDGTTPYVHPTTTNSYDAAGNLYRVTDARGFESVYQYDMLGREKAELTPYWSGGASVGYSQAYVAYTYDPSGRITSVQDPNSGTIYEYDVLGHLHRVLSQNPATGSFNVYTYYNYDTDGLLTSTVDPTGRTTYYEYDNLGRMTKTKQDKQTTPASYITTTYEYDANNNLTEVIDPQGNHTTYGYDNLNRRTSMTQPNADGSGTITTLYGYDTNSNLASQTDPLGNVTQYSYDYLNRRTSMSAPDPSDGSLVGPTIGYTYDSNNNVSSVTDPLGQVTSYSYDTLNRKTSETQPDPDGEGDLPSPVTTYTYDAVGNQTSLTDPDGNTTTWAYDPVNRPYLETNQLGKTRTYKYDGHGNLVERVDRLGRKIVYEYDRLNRNTAEKWYNSGSDTPVNSISFGYDLAGRLTDASDTSATYHYEYDAVGRRDTESQDISGLGSDGGLTPDIQYSSQYNSDGFRTDLSATINGTADFHNAYTPDNLQRLWKLVQQSPTSGNAVTAKSAKFTYYDDSEIRQIARFAGAIDSELVVNSFYSYDDMGRLKQLTHTKATSAPTSDFGSDAKAGYAYTYDDRSRITSINSYLDDLTDYSYDHTNQLTDANSDSNGDDAYSYDVNGNRAMDGYSTNSNNQLVSDGSHEYLYDDEGNRLSSTDLATGQITRYQYDFRNCLTEVKDEVPIDAPADDGDGTTWNWGSSIVSEVPADPGPIGGGVRYATISITGQSYTLIGGAGADLPGYLDDDLYTNGYPAIEGRSLLFAVSIPSGAPQLQFSLSDGTATVDTDYTNDTEVSYHSGNVMIAGHVIQGPVEIISVPTISNQIQDGARYLHFTAWFTGFSASSITLEGDILDDDGTDPSTIQWGAGAQAAPVAGNPANVDFWTSGPASLEYYVEDFSAHYGVDYVGVVGDSQHWVTLAPSNGAVSTGVEFPTILTDQPSPKNSFKIHVRVAGYPETARTLEADILPHGGYSILQTTTYAYDYANRLVRRTVDDDGPGEDAATDTFFSYDSAQVALQFDGNDYEDLSHRYLWGPAVDQLLADEQLSPPPTGGRSSGDWAGSVLWPLADHLGTIRDLATHDSSTHDTTVANHRLYDSFGNLKSESDDTVDEIFGFTGRLFDEITGLQNNLNRWYDSSVGRWISEDPTGLRPDVNPYRYVGNSSTNHTDPTGLQAAGNQNGGSDSAENDISEVKEFAFGDIKVQIAADASPTENLNLPPSKQIPPIINITVIAADSKAMTGNRWWISFKKIIVVKTSNADKSVEFPFNQNRPWEKDAGFKYATKGVFIDTPGRAVSKKGLSIHLEAYYAVGIVCRSATDPKKVSDLLASFTYSANITDDWTGAKRNSKAAYKIPDGEFPKDWAKLLGVTIDKSLNPK